MIQKICLIVFHNQYDSKLHFAEKLSESLHRLRVKTLLIFPEQGILGVAHYKAIRQFDPDFTLSFNTIMPTEGHYLWDLMGIPHLAALVDPAFGAIDMTHSPQIFFSTVDRSDCAWLMKNGVDQVFFWPHGVEKEVAEVPWSEIRPFDVAFLGTFTDFEGLKMEWQKELSPGEIAIVQHSIELVLNSPPFSLVEALAESVKKSTSDPRTLNYKRIFYFLDNYTRGKDRFELVRSITGRTIHIFGEPSWNNPLQNVSWPSYFSQQDNIVFHPAVSYADSFAIMRQSKICLNSNPFFKHGSHERILNALSCGAVPLTTHNGFVEEYFTVGEDLLTYKLGHWDKVNEAVENLLGNEKERVGMVIKGKEKVLKEHTWDVRAKQLLVEADRILEAKMRS